MPWYMLSVGRVPRVLRTLVGSRQQTSAIILSNSACCVKRTWAANATQAVDVGRLRPLESLVEGHAHEE
jgi:hypothetical protein